MILLLIAVGVALQHFRRPTGRRNHHCSYSHPCSSRSLERVPGKTLNIRLAGNWRHRLRWFYATASRWKWTRRFWFPATFCCLKLGNGCQRTRDLLEAFGLEIDESSLTGESYPVAKDASAVLPSETRVPDQTNMVFTGTVVTRGRAKAVVTQTGLN